MNNSTDGVTLNAVFINDVLGFYKKDDYPELYKTVEGLDTSDPESKVPISYYNDLCAWIEKELGRFNLIRVGRKIGETVYSVFIQYNMITEDSSPNDVLKALKIVASTMIQDPEGRGWEILVDEPKRVVMRRTQTFNSTLQFGLLEGLVSKTKVFGIKIKYLKEVQFGDEYDDYEITWK